MSLVRQSWVGMLLAGAILLTWSALHIHAVFFADLGQLLPTALLVITLTWLSVGLFIVAHDAMHGSLCPANLRVGNFTGTLALLLYAGFFMPTLRPKHHLHHRYPGSAEDPDFAPNTPSHALAWYGRFMKTYFGPQEMLIMAARTGVYMLLGAKVENILLFFAVPGILSSLQLFYFGTFLPHRHIVGGQGCGDFADAHHARSNEVGYLTSLFSCFHFGYHHEHHLHPSAPWWRLPGLRQRQ